MKRVLVTRPAPLAERTARRLAAMGFAPVLLPLTETRPLEVDPARIAAGRSAPPPPLTPPHKREGDAAIAGHAEIRGPSSAACEVPGAPAGPSLAQPPPPLTPPHKGEGDGPVSGSGELQGPSSAAVDIPGSPPPCGEGEGQGWGSEARPTPPKNPYAKVSGGAGLVAVTSANAILNAPGDLLRELSSLPCLAVGGATAAAARAAGFRSVSEGPGDAAGLALLVLSRGKAETVVYLCGRVRRPDFERALRAAGIEVTAVETYDTVAVHHDDGQAAAALGAGVIGAALVYSAAAAEVLEELAGREAFARLFRDTAFCCLSPRIAAPLRAEAGRKVLVPAEPTEGALLSLLAGPGGTSHHPSSFLAPVVW